MILYVEPFSGVSGDMFLSALCGLADAYDEIRELPDKLHLHDGRVEVQQLDKNGIVCRHIKIVDTGTEKDSPDAGESGRDHHHHEHHHHDHDHSHGHDHDHGDGHHHHHHHGSSHRHLSDILALIDAGHIPEGAKSIAKKIFTIIGESESRIHNIPLEKIHFHEVSGVDSILDIVGCALLIDRLGITETYSDPVCVGFGSVNTQHGLLPVPAPATADILIGMPTYKGDEAGERCTPTGAAILKFLNPRFAPCPYPSAAIAYGPGEKNFKAANVLRLSLAKPAAEPHGDSVWVIETSLDDMTPELLGYDFQNDLLKAGALDFHFSHIQMKKGRPALQLTALASKETRDSIAAFILEHTSTLGVRYYQAQRRVLERRQLTIDTQFGALTAKESTKPSGAKQTKYEYESLKELAAQQAISISDLKRRLKEF